MNVLFATKKKEYSVFYEIGKTEEQELIDCSINPVNRPGCFLVSVS